MAKVTGPLMSMDASGAYAGAIVFSRWKGRNTVRKLVTPANPMSADQVTVRNAQRVAAAGQFWANHTADVRSGETLTDKALLIAAAPSGQAWNGFLVKSEIGAGMANYDAATAAFNALTTEQKDGWDTAANGVSPAFPAVAQMAAGNVPTTALRNGAVFFHYVWGLYAAGLIATAPGAVPPTYA